jgi:hypothetical protein
MSTDIVKFQFKVFWKWGQFCNEEDISLSSSAIQDVNLDTGYLRDEDKTEMDTQQLYKGPDPLCQAQST